MRDKLIELLENAVAEVTYYSSDGSPVTTIPSPVVYEGYELWLADYLIAHGVTFAEDNNVPCKWIPVSERLPEKNATVFLRCKNGAVFSGYWFQDYENAVRWRIHTALSSTRLLNKGRVTHWMPLPELPKEVE